MLSTKWNNFFPSRLSHTRNFMNENLRMSLGEVFLEWSERNQVHSERFISSSEMSKNDFCLELPVLNLSCDRIEARPLSESRVSCLGNQLQNSRIINAITGFTLSSEPRYTQNINKANLSHMPRNGPYAFLHLHWYSFHVLSPLQIISPIMFPSTQTWNTLVRWEGDRNVHFPEVKLHSVQLTCRARLW